ncbi:hypothetical protein CEW92_12585 [Bacillaceae bacterium SAS-127]|nr:hypothetical protein CEW92_12585 [Bacillaceae bacterium SAS-127]
MLFGLDEMEWTNVTKEGPFLWFRSNRKSTPRCECSKTFIYFWSFDLCGVGVGDGSGSFGKGKGFITIAFSLGNGSKPFSKKRSLLLFLSAFLLLKTKTSCIIQF